MKATLKSVYKKSLWQAETMLFLCDESLGLRSALKQCASDNGIPYGDEMEAFVTWAEQQIDGGAL